jgi:hypothetical protein
MRSGQDTVPFGEGVLALRDTVLSAETCEELFTPQSPHIAHMLNGVEIVANGVRPLYPRVLICIMIFTPYLS